jgi:predicted N-acetyltransferase YhbS
MEIRLLTARDTDWERVAVFAENCSWRAGKSLARRMCAGEFTGWERVIALFFENRPVGYCTFVEVDCLEDTPYRPYIGYVFIEESHRGQRLCGRLLEAAGEYARKLGFKQVYLISDHVGLYEKFGFAPCDSRPAPWDGLKTETIFVKNT